MEADRLRIVKTLLIVVWVCQLFPAVPQTPLYPDGDIAAERPLYDAARLQESVPVLDDNGTLDIFCKISIRKPDSIASRNEAVFEMAAKPELPDRPSDARSMIRANMLQYFSGSKYKDVPLDA